MSPALGATPSQTVGPFFGFALPWPDGPYIVDAGARDACWVHGRVLDGAGEPVPDALVETWQADPEGRFDHPDDPRGPTGSGFRGFGRCPTGADGDFGIRTVKPGSVPAPDGRPQAPHIDVSVFARGMLHRVVTRVYFGDEPAANAADPVLAAIADSVGEDARATLVADPDGDGYRFDIRIQGEHETVFFDL